jgi:uncharacterized protein YciI
LTTDVLVCPIDEEYIEGFHRCLDAVARERSCLAFLQAPPLDTTREFVLSNIKNSVPPYVYMVKVVDPELFEHMDPDQEKVIEAHFLQLKKGIEEGQVALAGPCTDGVFGIVDFDAASDQEAEAYMLGDPALVAGIITAELHPFRISLMQNQPGG